jgi:hypothetical protein
MWAQEHNTAYSHCTERRGGNPCAFNSHRRIHSPARSFALPPHLRRQPAQAPLVPSIDPVQIACGLLCGLPFRRRSRPFGCNRVAPMIGRGHASRFPDLNFVALSVVLGGKCLNEE